jgi:hypothetical protein
VDVCRVGSLTCAVTSGYQAEHEPRRCRERGHPVGLGELWTRGRGQAERIGPHVSTLAAPRRSSLVMELYPRITPAARRAAMRSSS